MLSIASSPPSCLLILAAIGSLCRILLVIINLSLILLISEGKSTLQHWSMNHNCFRSKIGLLKEGLGLDVWDELKKSFLGVFIKFAELQYTWSSFPPNTSAGSQQYS